MTDRPTGDGSGEEPEAPRLQRAGCPRGRDRVIFWSFQSPTLYRLDQYQAKRASRDIQAETLVHRRAIQSHTFRSLSAEDAWAQEGSQAQGLAFGSFSEFPALVARCPRVALGAPRHPPTLAAG